MNRDLTVNIKIATASGDNARAATEAVKSVTDAARAATAANQQMAQSHQAAATAASAAASSARDVGAAIASQSNSMRSASAGAREYTSTMDRLDAKWAELEQAGRAMDKALNDIDSNRKKAASADREFLEGVQRLTGGLTQMARSVVLLTAANEEDAASMLKMIARFESVAQAVNGVIGVVQGATKAWQQYAIAAQLAGSTATAGGFVGKMAGTGAAVASIIGGAAGLFGAGSLIYQNLDNYRNGTNKTYAEDSIAQSLSNFAGFSSVFGGAGTLFKPYEDLYFSQQKTAQMETELTERQRLNKRRDDFARIAGMENLAISRVDFQENLTQSRFIAGLQDPTRNPDWRDSFQQAYRVNTVTANAFEERRKELEAKIGDKNSQALKDPQELAAQKKELEEVERSITATARERLSIMQQEAEVANRILASQREGLAQMSRGDSRKLADAIKSAADGTLTDKEIALLRKNNIKGYDDVIKANEERLIAADTNKDFIYRDQLGKVGAGDLTQNYNVAVNSEMVLKVQAEIDKKAPEWISGAMKFIQDQVEKIKAEAADVIKAQGDEQRREADKNSKAKDGGPGMIPKGNGVK